MIARSAISSLRCLGQLINDLVEVLVEADLIAYSILKSAYVSVISSFLDPVETLLDIFGEFSSSFNILMA